MAWESKTRQFAEVEMSMLEGFTAVKLAEALLNSDAVVALRALAEVMFHRDQEKLKLLLADTSLTEHWRKYKDCWFVDMRDDVYAQMLEQEIQKNIVA